MIGLFIHGVKKTPSKRVELRISSIFDDSSCTVSSWVVAYQSPSNASMNAQNGSLSRLPWRKVLREARGDWSQGDPMPQLPTSPPKVRDPVGFVWLFRGVRGM